MYLSVKIPDEIFYAAMGAVTGLTAKFNRGV